MSIFLSDTGEVADGVIKVEIKFGMLFFDLFDWIIDDGVWHRENNPNNISSNILTYCM